MTHLLKDILQQPSELRKSLNYALAPGWEALQRAAIAVREASHVFIAGIGSSWHAGMAVQFQFQTNGWPAILTDASELVHFTELPGNSVLIVLSRSGRSIEIRQLLGKARERQAVVIALTNDPASPLAQQADITLPLEAAFDHQVSVTMYTAPAMIGALLALVSADRFTEGTAHVLAASLQAASDAIPDWQAAIERSEWLAPDAPYYFLGRGCSLSSCCEARLLWEEATKSPACAMGTGAFRHGPQEIVVEGLRVGMWLDGGKMREEDILLAADLRQLGAKVMLIGQGVEPGMADLALCLPFIPPAWQFLIDSFPVQLAAERFARLRGVDCDSFRICSYIVETEGGLLAPVVDAS
jgi:glucosamine--fructose-6-phosphate aminotransferase (isomerizing)